MVSMNLRENVQPGCGINVVNGEDVARGPDYISVKGNGRLTRLQYKEKHESMQQRGTAKASL
jgi:hypothetical protein